jgi:hypothetical protein
MARRAVENEEAGELHAAGSDVIIIINPAVIDLNVKIQIKFKFKIFFWGQGLRPRNAPMLKPNTLKPIPLKPYGRV